jgi:Sulfatase
VPQTHRENIAVITLDSLRYDAAVAANTPFIKGLMTQWQENFTGWVKAGANATYTLPAHLSLFHAGILPCDNSPDVPPPYNRDKLKVFRATLSWQRQRSNVVFPTPEAPNIVKGFSRMGYRTLGIGGVHWFDTRYQTSGPIWKTYFDEFHWRPDFDEFTVDAFERQVVLARRLLSKPDDRPLFFFLNIASTHMPYRGNDANPAGQAKCLEYVDSHLAGLVDALPKPLFLVLMADHGDCMGEDGLWGHGLYHPKVMEIPMAILRIGYPT